MPIFPIDITQKTVDKLQLLVDTHNANQGATLTLLAWLELSANERAIATDLQAAVAELQRKANDDASAALQAAVATTRDQLLAAL